MATAVVYSGVRTMQNNQPKPRNHTPAELAEIVRKVHALRKVTKVTGFFTTNSIVELLSELSTDDLIIIGEELKLKPREMPRNVAVKQ